MCRLICIAIIGFSVVGCARDYGDTEDVVQPGPETAEDWDGALGTSALSGPSAYYIACASCHETGAKVAPLTGDPDAWAERSAMWQAVLAEHANKGYMEMPAKGGRLELPDWVVIRATEYMMSLTYPERNPE